MNDRPVLAAVSFEPVDRCPLCDNADRILFEREPTAPERIHLVRCSACEFIYTGAVVRSCDLPRIYNGYNAARDAKRADLRAKRTLMYQRDAAFARRFLRSGDARMLDVGSGTGDFSAQFADGLEVHAVEVDGTARAACAITHPALRLYPDLHAVPRDVAFDAIFFRGSLQYMPDVRDVAHWCSERLSVGGRVFVLATPNAESILAQLQREQWTLANNLEHRYWFTRRHLMRLFGGRFDLLAFDLPYLGTPYENYSDDVDKVLAMIESHAARDVPVAFFGSMMNLVFEKVRAEP
jgi:SAM-dependent methyltransferase